MSVEPSPDDLSGQRLERHAPSGATWVCVACGKTCTDQYGIDANSEPRGWDESCALNSILCRADNLVRGAGGRVIRADPWIADVRSEATITDGDAVPGMTK
jgi:hypothetical protein